MCDVADELCTEGIKAFTHCFLAVIVPPHDFYRVPLVVVFPIATNGGECITQFRTEIVDFKVLQHIGVFREREDCPQQDVLGLIFNIHRRKSPSSGNSAIVC